MLPVRLGSLGFMFFLGRAMDPMQFFPQRPELIQLSMYGKQCRSDLGSLAADLPKVPGQRLLHFFVQGRGPIVLL